MDEKYLEKHTIFKTIHGSRAYGTNTENSDLDIRGVAIVDDTKYYFGYLDRFEQFENKNDDIVIYDIRKFFKLASDNNPNIIELLFVDEKFWQKSNGLWIKIVENRNKFLSKNIRYRFLGYACAQLKRIKTARSWLLNPPKKKPERSDYGLPREKVLSKDDMGAFQWVMANLLQNTIEYLNLSEDTKEELAKSNWIGLVQRKGIPDHCFDEVQKITGASDAWMESMKREQAYMHAKRHYDSYRNWAQSRNKKRAALEAKFGYDTKHASHLVRLMRMGKEILSEGKVKVFRPDREELKAIRGGAWSYEQIEEYATSMEQEIIELAKTSELPNKPNSKFLNQLCVEIIEEYLKLK